MTSVANNGMSPTIDLVKPNIRGAENVANCTGLSWAVKSLQNEERHNKNHLLHPKDLNSSEIKIGQFTSPLPPKLLIAADI